MLLCHCPLPHAKLLPMSVPSATAMPAILYLFAVVWAIVHSSKRWLTFLWIVSSLGLTLGLFAAAAMIWPNRGAGLGDLAGLLAPLISGMVGIDHMRRHRRPESPKDTH